MYILGFFKQATGNIPGARQMDINHHSDHRPEIGSGKSIQLPPKRDWSKTTTFGGVSWSPECFRDRSRPFPTYFEHDAQRAFAKPLTEL
jgi:hypothetical protein